MNTTLMMRQGNHGLANHMHWNTQQQCWNKYGDYGLRSGPDVDKVPHLEVGSVPSMALLLCRACSGIMQLHYEGLPCCLHHVTLLQ